MTSMPRLAFAAIHGELKHLLLLAIGMCHHPALQQVFACRSKSHIAEEKMAVWQVMSIPEVLCVSWEGSSGRRTPNPAAIYPTAPACCLPWAWGDGTQGNEATSQDFVLKTPPGRALWMQLLCQQRQPRQTQAALGPWGSQVRSWDSSKLSQQLSRAPRDGMLQQGRGWACPFLTPHTHEVTHQPGVKPLGANW